jgi:hypothetical protein
VRNLIRPSSALSASFVCIGMMHSYDEQKKVRMKLKRKMNTWDGPIKSSKSVN